MMEPGRAERLLAYLAGISTWKQAFILITIGLTTLFGILIYQHPYWLENYWRYLHGMELREPR